jgi:cytochrome bd-type quinol oxidase subunit 1
MMQKQNAEPERPEVETLRLFYVENAKVVATFLEWRHRVMTFTVTVSAALVAIAGWLVREDQGAVAAVPLIVASALAFISIILDERNQRILESGYKRARELGRELHIDGNVFGDIPVPGVEEAREERQRAGETASWRRFVPKADPSEERWTYHHTLARFYLMLGLFFFGLAIWAVLRAAL